MAQTIHVKAQVIATGLLRKKYKDEYSEMYRQAVRDLGGTPRRSKEERIVELQNQIAQLEAK